MKRFWKKLENADNKAPMFNENAPLVKFKLDLLKRRLPTKDAVFSVICILLKGDTPKNVLNTAVKAYC